MQLSKTCTTMHVLLSPWWVRVIFFPVAFISKHFTIIRPQLVGLSRRHTDESKHTGKPNLPGFSFLCLFCVAEVMGSFVLLLCVCFCRVSSSFFATLLSDCDEERLQNDLYLLQWVSPALSQSMLFCVYDQKSGHCDLLVICFSKRDRNYQTWFRWLLRCWWSLHHGDSHNGREWHTGVWLSNVVVL